MTYKVVTAPNQAQPDIRIKFPHLRPDLSHQESDSIDIRVIFEIRREHEPGMLGASGRLHQWKGIRIYMDTSPRGNFTNQARIVFRSCQDCGVARKQCRL